MTKGDEVACRAIQERGYLVVGILAGQFIPRPGERLDNWCNMALSQPIVIVEETTEQDWKDQCRFLVGPFAADKSVPRPENRTEAKAQVKGATFLKAITD